MKLTVRSTGYFHGSLLWFDAFEPPGNESERVPRVLDDGGVGLGRLTTRLAVAPEYQFTGGTPLRLGDRPSVASLYTGKSAFVPVDLTKWRENVASADLI